MQACAFEQLIEAYPHLNRDDIFAALSFAAEMLHDEKYLAAYKAAVERQAQEV